MRSLFFFLFSCSLPLWANFGQQSKTEWDELEKKSAGIVLATKQIKLPRFPGAFNPSLIKIKEGYLLSFRFIPFQDHLCYSQIGLVVLDHNFNPLTTPQLVNTRSIDEKDFSQAEDARLFTHNGKIYLIYNDSLEVWSPATIDRRDMFMAEVIKNGDLYTLSTPLKLTHILKYHTQYWQKNWVPFEFQGKLLFTYAINPHEILKPNLSTGVCETLCETFQQLSWNWGIPRGSTPPLFVDGEYVAFLHSGKIMESPSSGGKSLWHYFMAAYTFSPKPPFELTKMTDAIVSPGFYENSSHPKRVIFPGGCVFTGDRVVVAYGRDDCEIWIATLDKNKLFLAMQPVGSK